MTGCLCNPGIAQVRTNHVCVPLRQLSMLFLRLDGQILFPHTPTEAELALLVSQRLDRSSRFLIEQIITERQLTQLWHHDMLLTLLRGTCLLCAEQHGAADLQLHLYEVHKCGTPLVKFFIQQLLPRFMDVNDTDYKCYACLQVFNTSASTAEVAPDPDRTQAALAHFRAQCPCLLQVAILLAKTAHGRHGHGRSHGSRRTDPCSLPASDPDAGPQSEVVPKCTAQKTTKRKSTADSGRKTRTRTAVSGKGQSGQRLDPHGQACHQVGQGSAADEERGHISFLFRQQRKRGKPPHPGASNRDMGPGGHRAQRAEDDIPSDATAPEAGHGLVPDPSDADQPIGGSTGGLRHQEGSHSQQGTPARLDMPIPGMEPRAEDLAGQSQAAPDLEEAAVPLQGHAGGTPGLNLGDEIPCSPKHSDIGGMPLENANQHPCRSAMASASGDGTFSHLASGWMQPETTQSATELTGFQSPTHTAAAKPTQGQGQEQGEASEDGQGRSLSLPSMRAQSEARTLLKHLSCLSLDNPGNLCFANATTYALLWTTLSTHVWRPEFWGAQHQKLQTFLGEARHTCSQLSSEDWFLQILRCWGCAGSHC